MDNYSQSFDRFTPSRQMLKNAENAGKQAYNSKGSTHNNALELNTGGQKKQHTLTKSENRSKRLQILMKPSTVKQLDKLAKKSKTSRNDIINQIINNYLERN